MEEELTHDEKVEELAINITLLRIRIKMDACETLEDFLRLREEVHGLTDTIRK